MLKLRNPNKFCRDYGLTANEMVDLCDSSMEMTRRAGEASDKAAQSGDPADHGAAADEHDNAEQWHDRAADERTGTAATVHSQFARDHHMMADQHRATGDFLARPEEPPAANDYEDDVDDSSDATQNQNHHQPQRRPKMTRPGQATQYLAQLRSQGVGGRALEQIENRLRHQTLTHNCDCHGRRRNEEDDALVPPTMNQILGIGGPEPTINSRMPNRNELVYGGIVEGVEPADALMTPALNYGRLTANVTGSAAGHSGHSVPGGKGYLTQSARDRQDIPGFNLPSGDQTYPDGNTGAYPQDGYREIPPLTSGRPRVKPTLGPPESGGNVGSYPSQGTRGDMGSTDSAGDETDYDPSAPVGRSASASGPRGSRSTRGRTVSNPVPQYGSAPPVEDRGDEQRGQIHTAGMSNAIYAADYWKRMTPGGIGEGANALPQDADGQDYRRSPTQDEDDDRRQFGNQKKRRPTANVETDALIAPTIDWQQQSSAWSKGASR